MRDYGCATDPNDTNEGDNELYSSSFTFDEAYYACGVTAAQNKEWYGPVAGSSSLGTNSTGTAVDQFCPLSTSRCKLQYYTQTQSQANLYVVMKYRGEFQVCYRYDAGIVTVLSRTGGSTYTRWPWNFGGNAEGYPNHYRAAKYVDFRFRYKAEFCPVPYGCTTTKWPYFTIRFTDRNTMSVIDLGIG